MGETVLVTILGKSGSGKSTSIRNLNPETTAVISTDGKVFPFRNGGKFMRVNVTGEHPDEMFNILERLQTNDKVETVVIDAFTQWSEAMTYFFNRKFKNFDRQNHYNDSVFLFWDMLPKLKNKIVYVFAHPALGETYDGEEMVVAKVDNKLRRGIIEERSTIVLMTKLIKGDDGIKYVFETRSINGRTPTKAPLGMFDTQEIDNDLALVNSKIKEYYSDSDDKTLEHSDKKEGDG